MKVAIKLLWLGIVATVAVSIFYDANFVFGDEHIYINTICRGIPCKLMAIRKTGRFYPLTHWDDNFVLLIPGLSSEYYALAMYVANALLFFATMVFAWKIMSYQAKNSGMGVVLRTAVVFAVSLSVLLLPDFLRTFWTNIFPESRLVLTFSLFVWCVLKTRETGRVGYMIGAVLSGLLSFGYKETSFIPCVVVPGTLLAFDYKGCGKRFRLLCWILLALGISYVIFYFGYWARGIEHSYNEGRTVPLTASLTFYLSLPLVAISFLFGMFRGIRVLFFREKKYLVYDAVLFAALSMVCAYISMGLVARYYAMPAQLILLYVWTFWGCNLYQFKKCLGLGVVVMLMFVAWSEADQTIKQWRRSVKNRSQDMAFVQTLASDKTISRILYCRSGGAVENYYEKVFRSYFRYVGGDEKICRSTDYFDGVLAINEVAVFYFHDPEWRDKGNRLRHAGRKVLESSKYTAVYGSSETANKTPADVNAVILEGCDDDECFRSFYSSDKTDGGRWGRGNVGLVMKIPENLRGKDLDARMNVGGVRGRRKEPNQLEVLVGGAVVARTELGWKQAVEFSIPGTMTNCAELEIGLKTAYVVCPKQEGLNSDNRELGVYFRSLRLKSAESEGK